MIWQKARFLLTCACVLTLSLLTTACEPSSNDPVAQFNTPVPTISFQGENDQKEFQTIELDNCNGKAELVRTERRTQTVSVAVSEQIALTLGVSIEVISAEVQGAIGVVKSDGQERSIEITLNAPPGSRMVFQLAWLGKEQIGIAENVKGWTMPIAFKRFTPSDVRINSQIDIGCPISGLPTLVATQTSAPQTAQQTRIIVEAKNIWQNTGILVNAGDLLDIQYVSGNWSIWSGVDLFTDGNGQPGRLEQCKLLLSSNLGALIGRVANGTPFNVGNGTIFRTPDGGALLLSMNDCGDFRDNGGSLTVEVTVQR